MISSDPVNIFVIFLTTVVTLLRSESIDDVDVRDILGIDGNLTVLSHHTSFEEKCKYTYMCWPGKCIVKDGEDKCLCPEGFYAKYGLCKRITRLCKYSFNCSPGYCILIGGKENCFCPPEYFSNDGACTEIEPKCRSKRCTPGICNIYRSMESCLCPQGYTAHNGTCIEIKFSESERASIVMMMVIVAGASIIVTTLIGLCICYYFIKQQRGT